MGPLRRWLIEILGGFPEREVEEVEVPVIKEVIRIQKTLKLSAVDMDIDPEEKLPQDIANELARAYWFYFQHEYRAAVMSAITAQEVTFKRLLNADYPLAKLIDLAAHDRRYITEDQYRTLSTYLFIRNRVAHSLDPVSKKVTWEIMENVSFIAINLYSL